ncbi:hypothetical protein F4810DRAFT_224232 [Camillea tinctor]|nr:hypothetical protein F4810DRAFT_224232 [Camillea tinctor]
MKDVGRGPSLINLVFLPFVSYDAVYTPCMSIGKLSQLLPMPTAAMWFRLLLLLLDVPAGAMVGGDVVYCYLPASEHLCRDTYMKSHANSRRCACFCFVIPRRPHLRPSKWADPIYTCLGKTAQHN